LESDKIAKEPTKILYLSRHHFRKEQIKELEEIFGPVEITTIATTIHHPREIKVMMSEIGAEIFIGILPLRMFQRLADWGVKAIQPIMHTERDEQGKILYKHDYFALIDKVVTYSRDVKNCPQEAFNPL